MKVVFSPSHINHNPEYFVLAGRFAPSPECPDRAHRLIAAINGAGYEVLPPKDLGLDAISAIHPSDYLEFLQHGYTEWEILVNRGRAIIPNTHPGRYMTRRPETIIGKAGYYMGDTACPILPGTWGAAVASAQTAVTAANLVIHGAHEAYALCRPPGHHAYSDQAGGFCFLNNVAIATQEIRSRADRVAILDVDVHHGNGTQGIFYDRDDILFCSLHGDPSGFYPYYAGYADERGVGKGLGYNLNIPLAPDTGDDAYMLALGDALGAIEAFEPEYLLISLGLDAQENDPLGILSITTNGFYRMGRKIGAMVLPTIIVQEGGYLCEEIEANLLAFLGGFEEAR